MIWKNNFFFCLFVLSYAEIMHAYSDLVDPRGDSRSTRSTRSTHHLLDGNISLHPASRSTSHQTYNLYAKRTPGQTSNYTIHEWFRDKEFKLELSKKKLPVAFKCFWRKLHSTSTWCFNWICWENNATAVRLDYIELLWYPQKNVPSLKFFRRNWKLISF